MPPELSLILGSARESSFLPSPYQVDDRAQRPGELADLVRVQLSAELRAHAEALAAVVKLPIPLVVVLAVEGQRALEEAARAADIAPNDLARDLDDSATASGPPEFESAPTRPLRAYAAALRSGGYQLRSRSILELVVPDRLRARWSIDATAAGMILEEWIAEHLRRAMSAGVHWEAQAATEGRTLAEWISLQALRRSRRSSSPAHPTAWG